MSWWLIVTPALAWLVAGTFGIGLISRRPETIWRGLFSAFMTNPPPYDPHSARVRSQVLFSKALGWLLIAAAAVFTLMSILVATGVVPPANN